MFDSTKTMREIATEDPLFAEYLVSQGFPFTVDNPVTEIVTFDDVVEVRQLNKDEFLANYVTFAASKGEVREV